MPPGPDFYPSMTALYAIRTTSKARPMANGGCVTSGVKSWKNNPSTMRKHRRLSWPSMAVASSLAQARCPCHGRLPSGDPDTGRRRLGHPRRLAVRRLLSRETAGCTSRRPTTMRADRLRAGAECSTLHQPAWLFGRQANGKIQLGGLDFELRDIVLEELNPLTSRLRLPPTRCLPAPGQITSPTRHKVAVARNSKWGRAIAVVCTNQHPPSTEEHHQRQVQPACGCPAESDESRRLTGPSIVRTTALHSDGEGADGGIRAHGPCSIDSPCLLPTARGLPLRFDVDGSLGACDRVGGGLANGPCNRSTRQFQQIAISRPRRTLEWNTPLELVV